MPSVFLNIYSLSALVLVGTICFAVVIKFFASTSTSTSASGSSNARVKGRMLNGLWWGTAGLLVLWGRASKWSLQPSLLEFAATAAVWTICAVLVTDVMLFAGARVRLLEQSLPKQVVLGSLGHAAGSIVLLGLLFAASQLEPFTITCPAVKVEWMDAQAACRLDPESSNCHFLAQCYGYSAQYSDGGLLLIVVLLLTAWIPTASSIAQLFRSQRIQTEASNTRSALAEARLQSIRHQVNSHLVFNALNSILVAVEDQSPKAGEMIIDLSQLLRNSLESEPSAESLGNEGERLCLYLRIEKSRFEEDLSVSYQVAESLKAYKCLPMTVQPLVENAIKHGFRSGRIPLHIVVEGSLCGDRVRVCVLNDGRLLEPTRDIGSLAAPHSQGPGVGLQLLGQRLEAAYGDNWKMELTEEEIGDSYQVRATVEWPAEKVEGVYS